MDYIKEAENYLKYYNDLYKSIEIMKKRRRYLIYGTGPKSPSTINYDITGIHSSGKYDEMINIIYEIQRIDDSIKETSEELKKIDEILDDISKDPECEFYGPVLRKWYIEKVPKEEIAEQIGYSSRQSIYTIKNLAIRKFAIRMFGIEALKAV